MLNRRSALGLIGAAPVLALAGPAFAASPETFQTMGIAIHGTDPVAYFTDARPVAGSMGHALAWRGAKWVFANEDNMRAFEANPTAYAPRFGGYCAYAAAEGAVATSVPEAWTIWQDRLYLNFSTGVRDLWRKDIPGYVAKAEANWPGILG